MVLASKKKPKNKERNVCIRPHNPPAGPQRPSEHVLCREVPRSARWRDSSRSRVCVVTRVLVMSGYKWGDLDDTRAAL